MAIVVKWKEDGQYLSEFTEMHGGPAMKWSASRREAIRFPSRAVALSRIETHFGRPVEVIRHEARFVRLVPKRRAEQETAAGLSEPTARKEVEALRQREEGAAEMREQAASIVDAAAHNAADRHTCRRLRELAGRIRDLSLDGAPPAATELSAEDADVLLRSGAWRRDGELWRGPDGGFVDPRTPFGVRTMREAAQAMRAGSTPAGLSAEDAETLRGAGWEDRLGIWYSPLGPSAGDYDPGLSTDLAALRAYARLARSKAPPVARGTPGKATGAEAAGAGNDSLAEEQGAAQGAPAGRGGATVRAVTLENGVRIEMEDTSGEARAEREAHRKRSADLEQSLAEARHERGRLQDEQRAIFDALTEARVYSKSDEPLVDTVARALTWLQEEAHDARELRVRVRQLEADLEASQ